MEKIEKSAGVIFCPSQWNCFVTPGLPLLPLLHYGTLQHSIKVNSGLWLQVHPAVSQRFFYTFLTKLKYSRELSGNDTTNKIHGSSWKNDLLSCQQIMVWMENQKQTWRKPWLGFLDLPLHNWGLCANVPVWVLTLAIGVSAFLLLMSMDCHNPVQLQG